MTDVLVDGVEPTSWRDQFGYMTPDHPDAFKDIPIKPNIYKYGLSQKCMQCHGYGMWNLVLDEYPRQQGYNKHFRRYCNNCNGYGWTRPETHIHNWRFDRTISNCYTQYRCTLCPKVWKVDSGG